MASKLTTVLLLMVAPHVNAIIGYDCNGQHLNTTTLSLLNTGTCNQQAVTTNSSTVYIQLLQLADYNYAEIIQCKVRISRTLYYCGMHSHISAVHNGHVEYIKEISKEACKRMHYDGVITLGNNVIINQLKVNRTTSSGITLAGMLTHDGKCEGIQYSDPYGTWLNVVAQAAVTITLKSGTVPVKIHTDQLILKSGVNCPLQDGRCLDEDGSYTFWEPLPPYACNANEYDVLYEGQATKTVDASSKFYSPEVYSLSTKDVTFALTKTAEQPLCGFTLAKTEHPKLYIIETRRGEGFLKQKTIPVNNLDIFAYVNSKFVYVEKHIRTQMTSLYNDVIQQKCDLEQQVLKNALALATLQPDEFAYTVMKEAGHMAVPAGEVIHIIKCIPIEVTLRKTETCYIELPVTVRNATRFLSPKSRIITKYGTERECNALLPITYRIEDTWYQFTPHPVETLPPQLLQPLTTPRWKYQSPGSLAVSGIYSEKDIEKLRDHIMFPAEKTALLNTIARGMSGHQTGDGSISMYNLLDEDTLDKITQSAVAKLWNGFMIFGSTSAGLIGVFMLIRFIKIVIDTFIHGYSLHRVYGCSLHLVASLWSSITHLLLHMAAQRTSKETTTRNVETAIEGTSNAVVPEPPPMPTSPPAYMTRQPTHTITYKELKERIDRLEQTPDHEVRSFQGGRCDVPTSSSNNVRPKFPNDLV